MPNLRGKTWTDTTLATVADAQYWEDHLISDLNNNKISGEPIARAYLGAHQLFDFSKQATKTMNVSGTWSGDAYTRNGVTYTINSDNSVTLTSSGAVGSSQLSYVSKNKLLKVGQYKISGCQMTENIIIASIDLFKNGAFVSNIYQRQSANDGVFNYQSEVDHDSIVILFSRHFQSQAVSGTIKPMLTLVSDYVTEFLPYAKPNSVLTEDINGISTSLDSEVITRASLGAHNLLELVQAPFWSSSSGYTFNDTGIALTSFTPPYNAEVYINKGLSTDGVLFKAGSYIISNKQTTNKELPLYVRRATNNIGDNVTITVQPNQEATLTLTADTCLRLNYWMESANTYTGVLSPMIRLATDSDSTYQPYAKTNKQLTDNVTDIETAIAPIEIGTASQAYAKGDYLIMNDKLYKATTAIVSGATLTVGTNIVQTSVGDELRGQTISKKDSAFTTVQNTFTNSTTWTATAEGWYNVQVQVNSTSSTNKDIKITLDGINIATHRTCGMQYERVHTFIPLKKGTVLTMAYTDTDVSCQYTINKFI